MKKKIINGILAVAILFAAPSAFVSCKDNDADLRTELLGKIADLKNQLENIQLKAGPQGEKGDKGDAAKVEIKDGYWYINDVNTGVPATGDKGEKGDQGEKGEKGDAGDITKLTIGGNGNWFVDGKDTGIPARGEKGDQGEPGDITKISIGDNGNWFIDGGDTGVSAKGQDGVTPMLVQGADGHYYWWINGEYTGVRADGDGTNIGGSTYTIYNGTWWIDGADTGVLAYNLDDMLKLIRDQIYNAERDGLTPELEAIIKKLLNNLDDAVEKSIKEMVTDVIAERTENSFYGQLAIPGYNPLIVAAYYADLSTDVKFPASNINILNVEQYRKSAGATVTGEGGKVYLTLNPNEVETAGKTLSLVTSQDKTSPFTLGGLQASNTELTFGWNRTRSNTGLYEATVELSNPKAAGINIQSDLLKDDAKQILDQLRTGGKKNIATSVANLMGDVFTDAIETMPAYAVKVQWNDQLFGLRTVRSGYDIAAFSVNPLAYDFEYSISGTSALADRVFDKVSSFKDGLINSININLNLGLSNIDPITIKSIDLTNKTAQIVVYDPVWYNTNKNNWESITDTEKNTHITGINDIALSEFLSDLANEINGMIDADQLNSLITKIQSLESNLNGQIASTKNSVKAQIQDYLDAFHNKFNSTFGGSFSLNKLVNPVLLVKSNDGISRATGSFSGEITLLPTSYTVELLAPALKKFVVITEVNGDASAAAAANTGDLGQILDGGVQEVKFTPAAGKTYTIAYSAVDYKGNVVTNYYYISGK